MHRNKKAKIKDYTQVLLLLSLFLFDCFGLDYFCIQWQFTEMAKIVTVGVMKSDLGFGYVKHEISIGYHIKFQ